MSFFNLGRFTRIEKLPVADATLSIIAPILAFLVRDVALGSSDAQLLFMTYVCVTALTGVLAIRYVQISQYGSGFLAASDLIKIFKAALIACMSGVVFVSFFSHLHYPRSIPVIHFFLFSGLLTALTLWRMREQRSTSRKVIPPVTAQTDVEHQLLIGFNPLSVHYVGLMDAIPSASKKVAGIVSISGDLVGTQFAGRTVLGPIENIIEILIAFHNHGIAVDRLVIASTDVKNQQRVMDAVQKYCSEHSIAISFLTDLFAAPPVEVGSGSQLSDQPAIASSSPESQPLRFSSDFDTQNGLSRYLQYRQRFDWIVSIILFVPLLPILLSVAVLVFIDLGRPIIFWQTRIGRFRQLVTIHKFRTLPHPTEMSSDASRHASAIGRFLQATRLDELPQIIDVLRGELSFIGPRPLLFRDLPKHTGLRERVLPGITGWAQIHGGKHVSAEEKIALDHWYLRHASPILDAYILFKTLLIAFRRSELRNEGVISAAIVEYRGGAEFSRNAHSEGDPNSSVEGANVVTFFNNKSAEADHEGAA